MSLKIYNVLNRKKEEFIPLEEGKVKMYACGITASGDAHIGHAFQAIVFDMIKKYLNYSGYEVKYVRNYTDVDDKIIVKAREEGVTPKEYADKMMKKIDEELAALDIEPPTIQSKATECITDMINAISKLIEKGFAYATDDGDVFFSVESFPTYGKFSNRELDKELSGIRKEIVEGKRDNKDFALWKSAGEDEIYWDSPWGKGRPGWHIECSAMSIKYLGETLDIHGGGKDLVFPHHENEIAQSEALTGKQFSKYWMHNGLIKINGSKMSKSLGNGVLVEDLIKNYNYEVVRMTLLQNHYRSDVNLMDGMLELNEAKIYDIYKLFKEINDKTSAFIISKDSSNFEKYDKEFREAMDNDFNTSLAISNLLTNISELRISLTDKSKIQEVYETKESLIKIYKVLGLLQQNPQEVIEFIKNKYLVIYNISKDEILELINKRNECKKEKDYAEADKLRAELLEKGIIIKDSREGTNWDIDIKKTL